MSAATAPLPNAKSGEAKAHEPSMEEILASIRRIIADDQALPLTPRPSVNLRAVAAEPAARAVPNEAVAEPPPRRAPRPPLSPESDAAESGSPIAATAANAKPNAAKPAPAAAAPPTIADREVENRGALQAFEARLAGTPLPTESQAAAQASATAPAFEASGDRPVSQAMPSTRASVTLSPMLSAMSPATRDDKLLSPSADASVASSFNVLATTMFIQNSGAIEQAVREMLRPMLQRWLDDNLPTMVERLVRAEIERVARGGRG